LYSHGKVKFNPRARPRAALFGFPRRLQLNFRQFQINFRRQEIRMSELREQRWSVVSERGCEASSVNYEEAARLVSRLRADKVHGLCIISDEAARRYNSNNNGAAKPNAPPAEPPVAAAPPAKKRAPRRKNAKPS
jgi:hypothetical protein